MQAVHATTNTMLLISQPTLEITYKKPGLLREAELPLTSKALAKSLAR